MSSHVYIVGDTNPLVCTLDAEPVLELLERAEQEGRSWQTLPFAGGPDMSTTTDGHVHVRSVSAVVPL